MSNDTEAVVASDGGAGVEREKTMSTTSMNGVRKVRIRIKISERISCESSEPKQQLEDDRMRKEGDQDQEEEAERHQCALCDKDFRSVKALAGHMRVHSQRERNDVDDELVNIAALGGGGVETDDEVVEEEKMKRGGGGKQLPMCPICEKNFPSNKALFGHMRCHPDRNWRGIQPPVDSSSSTVSDVQAPSSSIRPKPDDDDVINGHHHLMKKKKRSCTVDYLEKDLIGFGWGAKAMRGRQSTVKSSQTGCSGVDFRNLVEPLAPDQADCVENLLFLSQGGDELKSGKKENKMVKKRKNSQAEEITNKKFKFDHLTVTGWVPIVSSGNNNNVAVDHGYGITAEPNVYNAASADQHILQQADKKMHKVRKYLMVNDLKPVSVNPPHSFPVKPAAVHDHHITMEVQESERYKCTTCNKSFSSHQALGGHMSSHNKLRNTPGFKHSDHHHHHPHYQHQEKNAAVGREDYYISNVYSGANSLNFGVKMAAPAQYPSHQCNVCSKTYPTGQALGGHKRLHCSSVASKATQPLPALFNPEPEAAAHHPPLPPVSKASDNPREVCKFDLNEPPSLEDDEAQDAIYQPADNNTVQYQQALQATVDRTSLRLALGQSQLN